MEWRGGEGVKEGEEAKQKLTCVNGRGREK